MRHLRDGGKGGDCICECGGKEMPENRQENKQKIKDKDKDAECRCKLKTYF